GTGLLQTTILPAGAAASGAQWLVDGGSPHPSGANIMGLSVGNHTLSFTPINGWTTPASQTVTIKNGQGSAASGVYTFLANYGLVANGGFETGDFTGWTFAG